MTNGGVTIGRGALLAGAVALVLGSAGVTYVITRDRPAGPAAMDTPTAASPAPPAPGQPAPAASARARAADSPLPDVEVAVTEEAMARAGIEVSPVGSTGSADAVRIPAVIEANAYRRVTVTPLVGGRVTRVEAELGDTVKRGATLALVYSPGLADVQTKYLSTRAELEAAAQELRRTERLVAIGAASQQELERIRATHTSVATTLEGARAQLVLLGMTRAAIDALTMPNEITATTRVTAPIDGVVIERQANLGLNVEPAMPLFTVADLSNVWAVGDLYERDFPRVRVGSEATITTTAYPGLALRGRVAYIDPQLSAESRTARVRVEVPNPRRELRFGMYAELQIVAPPTSGVVTVPREAVQTIGDRQFVYLARPGQRGTFVEREVRLGDMTGGSLEITSGVKAGDAIVTKGSFFVRAERERLGLRAAPGSQVPAGNMPGMAMGGRQHAEPVRVHVTEKGFEPARVTLSGTRPVRITFVRTTDNTCAKELAVPALNIKRALPLNEPVVVELPQKPGEVAFTCGMNMFRGAVVVQ